VDVTRAIADNCAMSESERGAAQLSEHERVLDALAVGVIVHDAALKIVYTNRSAAALLGVEVADALERDVADPRWIVIHPDGSPVNPADVPASVALRTREPVRGMILGVKQPDGVTTWLAVDGVPLLSPSGQVELVGVTVSDVTRELVARMQLEGVRDRLGQTIVERDAALAQAVQALDSSEARYRAVLRSMSEGVVVHAADGAISFANPAAQSILGLSLEQMQGRHPVDPAWHLTDASGLPLAPHDIPSEITRCTGEPQRNTQLGVQRGEPFEHAWLSVSTDPIGEASEPKNEGRYSVVATFTDVTAERNALEEAQLARDHLRDIAAALPGVVMEYLVRPDGSLSFRYVSEPAREYLGVAPADVLRDSSVMLARVHPRDKQALLNGLSSASESHGVQFEFRISQDDGTDRHVRLRAGPPTRTAEGKLYRSVLLDVTEQRRLEETVREAQRREAMGTLAAGMAHNFNNMLAVIVPSLDMVREQVSPEIAAELEDARSAANAATELVRQLMQLVRRDAPGQRVPVEVGALVEEVSQLCRRTFDASINIRFEAPRATHNVLARRAELQQAIVNLCINARDALDGRAGARLDLNVRSEGDSIIVEVTDNGSGMSVEVQRRLGEPFFSTKAPGRGTGLGLATAFGIVSELQGVLTCHSREGQGTRFEMRLPRCRSEAEAGPNGASEGGTSSGLLVLVVDDEELVRNTLRRVLTRLGARVLSASNGIEALSMLRAAPDVSLVFLDVAMPELSGTDVLRRIREFEATLPVYLMTGFLPDRSDTSGATGVLTKPVELGRVRELLAEVASR
jgi:two-component system cell cycle sensor histidine kinase/response regulator CckA